MIVFLRFVGVINAAVWFGAAVFFTFAVAPAIFTPDLKRVFGEAWIGIIAQTVLERYFALQLWCGAIALVHQLAEWVYLGRKLHRLTLGIILALLCLGLTGVVWLQPKMEQWHRIRYSSQLYGRTVHGPDEIERAARLFRFWHGVSMILNFGALGGLTVIVWRVANPAEGPRFVPANKFRS